MFAGYVYKQSSAEFSDRVMLVDADGLEGKTNYSARFGERGFQVIRYAGDLRLRLEHEDAISGKAGKYLLLVNREDYVPYDIIRRFRPYTVSLSGLFPKLNPIAVKEAPHLNYDLLALAYSGNFADLRGPRLTERFLENTVYGRGNVEQYLHIKNQEMHKAASAAAGYKDWCHVASLKAVIDSTAARFELEVETDDIQGAFARYILSQFGTLSSVIDRDSPVLVSRAMEYMAEGSEKFAVVVMDGMSESDWQIIARSFDGIRFEKASAFAMIPTTTSISRQCLLSNKYPSQLEEPWGQSREKYEFAACARGLGFTQEQIGYGRGYDASFGAFVKCAAVVINDVDDMVHAQMHGRAGLCHDVSVLTRQRRLADMVKRLLEKGFDVYITADHGNTPCIGVGRLTAGVEVETRSRRMLVLKDFADKQRLMAQYDLIDFPKYYLNKEYDYLLCGAGSSFDARGEAAMSHGGITVDEVIVPFIKIKAVENNG